MGLKKNDTKRKTKFKRFLYNRLELQLQKTNINYTILISKPESKPTCKHKLTDQFSRAG